MTDILYAHIEDLGEPLRTLYGINVYADPSCKTLEREAAARVAYISFSSTQEYPTTHVESRTYEVLPSGPEFDLTTLKMVECKDKALGLISFTGTEERPSWTMHKDNGTSYWNYAPEEMQRVLRLENVSRV